jgi:hypothetical protein
MTEAEWLSCTDPMPILAFLRGQASERMLRLFACACCRRIWHLLNNDRNRKALETAERYAEGLTGSQELAFAQDATGRWRLAGVGARQAEPVLAQTAVAIASYVAGHDPWRSAADVARTAAWLISRAATGGGPDDAAACDNRRQEKDAAKAAERMTQAVLVRDIFGNPFRPSPTLPPAVLAWNDGTVRLIAEGIYDDRKMPEGSLDTARLAILADALLDAGCDDDSLIQHCREPGPHVRGCWAVDLILGKE